jgi:Gas vesicle synthesis protein GvpL/GvpF
MRKRSSAVRRGKPARPQARRGTKAARPAPGKRAGTAPPPRNVNPSQDVARVARADTPAPNGSARGKYVYCVIRSNKSLQFGLSTIAGEVGGVHTVNYKDLAAVVSDVPVGPLDSTRENVLAHEHVNETVMKDHTVIPMSFGTIFKTRDDALELLRSAHDAFDDVLSKMQNKLEFGLKVLWDRDAVITGIEEEDEDIRRLRNEIASQKGSTYFARMQYGRLVEAALQSRSERYVSGILEELRAAAVAARINKPIGDKMILNGAFLVSRDSEAAFDQAIKQVASQHEKLTFKYTGPWPPYNFVNIRLKLERA